MTIVKPVKGEVYTRFRILQIGTSCYKRKLILKTMVKMTEKHFFIPEK